MRICFLADGGHINCQNWARYFAVELGHEVLIISLEKVEQDIPSVKIYEIEVPHILRKLKYLCAIQKVKKAVDTINPDVLIGYRVSSYGFLGACSGFHPFVLAAQGYNIDNPENSKVKNVFIRFAVRRGDLFHAWGKHMAEKFSELGAAADQIIVFPRGIRTDIFKLTKYPDGVFTLIMTRGLKSGYNLELPFKALTELKKAGIDFKFLVAGDGSLKESLSLLAKDLGISNQVQFFGYVENFDLPKIMIGVHVYVSPVPTDGVSSSMLEAMSCGLIPVVVNNEANQLWIQNEINGLLFNAGDNEAMGKALIKIANHKIDIDWIRKYNRDLVCRKADWKTNMQRIENEFHNLISVRKKQV